jgi:hypothetical protein
VSITHHLLQLAMELPAEVQQSTPPVPPTSGGSSGSSIEGIALRTLASAGPVGVFLLMVLFRWKVMPTYVFDAAKKEWDRERSEKDETIKSLTEIGQKSTEVYINQVVPTMTRALDLEKELLDLRREDRDRDRRRRDEP